MEQLTPVYLISLTIFSLLIGIVFDKIPFPNLLIKIFYLAISISALYHVINFYEPNSINNFVDINILNWTIMIFYGLMAFIWSKRGSFNALIMFLHAVLAIMANIHIFIIV